MNVFVLNSGRSGSKTFSKACSHISNYSSGHEILCGHIGEARFAYPDNHIEADNRLSWLLGRLDEKYGDRAFYVHLHRDQPKVVASHVRRHDLRLGIIWGYRKIILQHLPDTVSKPDLCRDYCHTVDANIELFLRDKSQKMDFAMEHADRDFRRFWHNIGAEGDISAALREFDFAHNSTEEVARLKRERRFVESLPGRLLVRLGLMQRPDDSK